MIKSFIKIGNTVFVKQQIKIWKYVAVFGGNTAMKFRQMELRNLAFSTDATVDMSCKEKIYTQNLKYILFTPPDSSFWGENIACEYPEVTIHVV